MKLKELLLKLYEGTCERLPGESDSDFLTRCGNNGFDQMDRLRMAQNNMVWNRNVMKEKLQYQARDIGSPTVKLVFWDEKNEDTLKDPKKVKEILRVLERNLTVHKASKPQYDYSIPQIMNSFTYYKPTNKLIGDYPKFVFLSKNIRGVNSKTKCTMNNCRFKDELDKVSKTLEVKEKTVNESLNESFDVLDALILAVVQGGVGLSVGLLGSYLMGSGLGKVKDWWNKHKGDPSIKKIVHKLKSDSDVKHSIKNPGTAKGVVKDKLSDKELDYLNSLK